MKLIFLTVFLFFPISIMLSKISDKLLIKSVCKRYPNEIIIYKSQSPLFITLLIPFFMCVLPACIVLPYLLTNGILNFSTSKLVSFVFVFMVMPLCIFSVIIHNLFKTIITNKRITNGRSNSLLFKNINFLLKDIEKLEWQKPNKAILATFKNNEMFIFGQFTIDKNLYARVKKLIYNQKEVINDV